MLWYLLSSLTKTLIKKKSSQIALHKLSTRPGTFKIPETSLNCSAASVLVRLLLIHCDILGRTASSLCGISRLPWDVWYTVVVRIPFLSDTERPKLYFSTSLDAWLRFGSKLPGCSSVGSSNSSGRYRGFHLILWREELDLQSLKSNVYVCCNTKIILGRM